MARGIDDVFVKERALTMVGGINGCRSRWWRAGQCGILCINHTSSGERLLRTNNPSSNDHELIAMSGRTGDRIQCQLAKYGISRWAGSSR